MAWAGIGVLFVVVCTWRLYIVFQVQRGAHRRLERIHEDVQIIIYNVRRITYSSFIYHNVRRISAPEPGHATRAAGVRYAAVDAA